MFSRSWVGTGQSFKASLFCWVETVSTDGSA
jgi:hypothetical protein